MADTGNRKSPDAAAGTTDSSLAHHPAIAVPRDVSEIKASNILGFDANLSAEHPVSLKRLPPAMTPSDISPALTCSCLCCTSLF